MKRKSGECPILQSTNMTNCLVWSVSSTEKRVNLP